MSPGVSPPAAASAHTGSDAPALAWASIPTRLLLTALGDPASTRHWQPAQWGTVVRLARTAGLLGRLALRVGPAAPGLPPAVVGHFESALRVWAAQQTEIHREAGHLRNALGDIGAPVLLLKGAAYVMTGLPAADGRTFSDVDIMVPEQALPQAEMRLVMAGWTSTHHTAYDERYYRDWMHELPPMEHAQRRTVLDVHHTILPRTGRIQPDAAAFFESAQPLASYPGLHVLSPQDMLLHSMTHLFMNDELSHALRDLSDMDALMRHFGADPGFWPLLAERARRHGLQRLLFYALRYARRVFCTPVPQALTEQSASWGPGPALLAWMDRLWLAALDPSPGQRPGAHRQLALFALYLRGHWLRMPPLMLARHLSIKALRLHERKQAAAPDTAG